MAFVVPGRQPLSRSFVSTTPLRLNRLLFEADEVHSDDAGHCRARIPKNDYRTKHVKKVGTWMVWALAPFVSCTLSDPEYLPTD
jgi:hypothetical protein